VLGAGPPKLGHIAHFVEDPKAIADFYRRVLGFQVSDWIDDYFVFLRCNPDHHTVNFIRGSKINTHHIAFELKDFAHHMQDACELLALRKMPIKGGPARHCPGHNVAIHHRNCHDGRTDHDVWPEVRLRAHCAAPHSDLIWAARMTVAHFRMSLAIRTANSSGELATASKPSAASFSAASGCFMALTISR
jgi:catechol 2,3-dioxygenase-like lactoylglutathione lyase family enzyme